MRDPAPTSRSERKARTREDLKRAARRCFAKSGFLATQISDIARAAKVAQGTLYVHFSGKDAILDELLGELDRELVARLETAWAGEPAAAGAGDLVTRVHGLAHACLEVWHSHRDLLRAFAERTTLGVDLSRLQQGVSPGAARWLRASIDRTAAELGAPLPHPELVAQALLGLWMRVGLASLADGGPGRDELATLLTQLSLGALGAVLPLPIHGKGSATRARVERRNRKR